jgi:hypothetical protein
MNFTFKHVDVKAVLVENLEVELPKFGFSKVKVVKADPQSAVDIPCIGINRADDSESDQSIADASGTHFDAETKTHYRFYGTFFQESIEIRAWHTNADERDKLYQHMKAILFAMRPQLVEMGLLNLTLRGGRDEQDSSMAQAPMVLYWAPITMNFLNPMDVTFEEVAEPITAILDVPKGV